MPRGHRTAPLRWTDPEQKIFETVYPHCGAAGVHELLPDRSVGAIEQRATLRKMLRLPQERRRPIEDFKRMFAARPEESPAKRMVTGPGGAQFEYGTTAGTKPGLEPVPESATNLPWVSYPRDPASARAVAAACEFMAIKSEVVKKIGPEAQRFFESQARYLRAIADRMETSKTAA